MSNSSDDTPGAGPAGTARIDANPPPTSGGAHGPAGTARIDAAAAPQGAGGTARVDVAATGAGGTARVDVAAAAAATGAGGTARVDAAAAAMGAGGTARVDTAAVGVAGTARVGALPAGAAAVPDAAVAAGAAQHLMVGQQVVLQGVAYQVESALSTTTSEARTYVVNDGRQRLVLKHYKPNVRAPLAALKAIQAQPHANVVAIHASGTQDGQDFELLEYFAAGTLDHLLRHEGPLRDVERLRRLVSHLANGLQHLHERIGLIYQDLKPENVLISGPDFERVVLADFGISTLRPAGATEVQVTANGTREYAAPELARFGNETQTLVTDKVDYFALGITLLECWQGTRPFQGVPDGRRIAQVQDREVPFPPGMDASLETLIKGLLSPSVKQRFGLEQVRQWVAGQALAVDYQATQRVYERLVFRGDEAYQTPAELAALLERHPALGMDYLYVGTIVKWLEQARDMELATQIAKIAQQFDQDDAQRQAGLLRAIYTLDAARPFVSAGGRTCLTADDLGDALLAEQDHYLQSLTQPFDPFYLYLQARGESDFVTATRGQFAAGEGATLAFNQLVFALHGGGRNRIRLAGDYYYLPEDLNDAPAAAQQELRVQLGAEHSRALIWLQRLGVVEKLVALPQAEATDQMAVMGAFPWLRLAEVVPDLASRQGALVHALMNARRLDLFDECVQQGLDFNAPQEQWRPAVTAAARNDVPALTYLLDHGADLEVVDADGDTPLVAAVRYRAKEAFELLVARGANARFKRPDGHTLLGLSLIALNTGSRTIDVDVDMVRRVLALGVDANEATGPTGYLPLHLALVSKNVADVLPLVDLLLQHKADPKRDGPNAVLQGPPIAALMTACLALQHVHGGNAACLPVIERLLKAGVPTDATFNGDAALHLAARWQREDLVRLLLAHGAQRYQLGQGGSIAASHVRGGKGSPLEKLLAPSLGARLSVWLRWTGANMLQLLALLALGVSAGLVAMPLRYGMFNTPVGLAQVWGGLLLLCLMARLVLDASWPAFSARMKEALKTPKAWVRWLVVAPALWGVLGYFIASSGMGIDGFGVQLISVVVAGVLVLAAVPVAGRARRRAAPFLRYGRKADRAWLRWAAAASMLVLIAGALVAGAQLLFNVWLAGEPEPVRKESQVRGVLRKAYTVKDSAGNSCRLPAAQALTRIQPGPDARTLRVRVPTVPQGCNPLLLLNELDIPAAQIRITDDPDGVIKPAPAEPAAKPKAQTPTAAEAPAKREGAVQGLSDAGWPRIGGQTLPLEGLQPIDAGQRGRLSSWLRSQGDRLSCERTGAGVYRCLTEREIDAAEAMLLNGIARASDSAPDHYRAAMKQAQDAQRGLWK